MLRFNIPSYFDLSPLYLFLLFLQDIFYNNNRISGVIDVRIRHGTAAKGFNWKEGHDVVGQRYWFRFTGVLSASALSVSFEYDVDTVGRGGQGWRWGAKWKGDLAGALIQNGSYSAARRKMCNENDDESAEREVNKSRKFPIRTISLTPRQ